jgi:thioredoxin-related protein
VFLLKINFNSVLLIYLACFAFQHATAAPPEEYNFLPFDKALQQSANGNKPLFLYFGRYGCNTCRKMHKEIFSDPSLRQNLTQHFVLAYVDTESGNRIRLANGERTTEMQFASRSRILGTPTFVFFSKDQKPLFTKAGFQTISQMQQYSDFVSQEHYKTIALKQYLSTE